MIQVRLHMPIGNESNSWYYWWNGYEGAFSLEFVQRLFKDNPSETDFKFNIHCPGGEVEEGLAIYDYLRTSGKNIHMNIEGSCHSMAVTLLLAAPLENRSANPNCRALIHKVSGAICGNVDELEAYASDTRKFQESILDIYAERTGTDIEQLRTIMNEEKERTAQELMALGFISKINSYNTNFKKSTTMSKNIKDRIASCLNSISGLLGTVTNYEFVDAEGQVLFTTESEDDTLEVGMAASPDGTFTIADGRTVVIADGVITEIQDPEPQEPASDEEVANLRAENAQMREQLAEAADLIKDLQKQLHSNYQPGTRVAPQTKTGGGKNASTSEERKNLVKENIANARKK